MSMSDPLRVMVTGGAGFVGSHLCETLLNLGNKVICVDNYHTGCRNNIAHLLDHPGFTVLCHDICEPISIVVDQIYNLACPASPLLYQANPVKTTKTIVQGAINMLELARRVDAKILQASTSEVYGDPNVHPQVEEYRGNVSITGPRACYDEGKRCAESLFYDYHRQFGVQVKVARIFNTYGPRLHPDDGRVVSNFIVQALLQHEITVFGDGSQTRSFCYVDDLVDGLVKCMDSSDNFVGPINLGNPGEFSVLQLADLVIKKTNSRSRIVFKKLPVDDPTMRRPDIEKAKVQLGWSPVIGLDQGLDSTIKYFSELLAQEYGISSLK